ncbi:PspC domain protein [compost metagenome]
MPQPSTRRLVRSRNHKLLAGVCGGLAARLGISPALARALWLLLSLLPGPLWVLYLILWVVLPQENT